MVNSNGVIVTPNNRVFVNGGCLCGNTNNSFLSKIIKEDLIITISSLWADGIWHFPYEAFVALKIIPQDILKKSKIHVSKITGYIIQWFELINIPRTQLITGNVYANVIYLPRMGKCGTPYFSQIN